MFCHFLKTIIIVIAWALILHEFGHFINNKIIYYSNNLSCALLLPHNFITVQRCLVYKWQRNWNISLVFISFRIPRMQGKHEKHFLCYIALLDPLFSVFKLFRRCGSQSHTIKFKVNFVFHSLFCRPSPYKLRCYMKPRPIICTRGWRLRFNLFAINKFTFAK